MKLLDKYIIKKYIGTFLYLVLGLCLIICVIDYSEKIDDFKESGLAFSEVLTGYYAHLVPYLANFLSPLMIFIATILVTARLASHTEIIAILASGVSFKRIIWTYLMGAIVLACLTFVMIGWVIPSSNQSRIDFEIAHLGEGVDIEFQNVHVKENDSTYVYLQDFNGNINVGYHFSYEIMDGKELRYRLTAPRVDWDTASGHWKVKNYVLRTYYNGDEEYHFIKSEKIMQTTVTPEDFGPGYNMHQAMTIPQLKKYIIEETKRGTGGLDVYIMEYYERFAYPFAILILTFMGVVVSARKSREGIAKQLVVGFLLCFVYYAFLQLGRNFTQSEGLHPIISAWIPNTVFLLSGIVLYKTLPK